ncbi:ABC transporter ATP-binding protein [Streptomyces sp. NPDC047928]|uniref:ABC transporter ATP-binding protein n=1 Tax=unclassified Streptomyces TaxID=2593676 RepID=UPI0037166790
MHSDEPLLSLRDLRISFDGAAAVRGLSFDVHDGEALALVGESGAGKSLTGRALLGLVPREATVTGSARLRDGTELVGAKPSLLSTVWGRRIAFVPQDSLSALSPVHPVGDQLAAAVRSVRGLSRRDAHARAADALDRVGLTGATARAHPHELSGGMRQRAVIAMAMVNEPELVIADEPTTALDPDRRAQVLRLLGEQREATGAALLLVTHDLESVAGHADRVYVVYAGRHVESGPVAQVFGAPRAPYTAGLLASLPPADPPAGPPAGPRAHPPANTPAGPSPAGRRRRLPAIGGTPPAAGLHPPGCAFAPRCPSADDRCRAERPEPTALDDREVSCHRATELPSPTAELFLETR